jgi:hypothetical protein
MSCWQRVEVVGRLARRLTGGMLLAKENNCSMTWFGGPVMNQLVVNLALHFAEVMPAMPHVGIFRRRSVPGTRRLVHDTNPFGSSTGSCG